jgi:hypothetical protein
VEIDDIWSTRISEIHCDASDFGYGSTTGLWGLWKKEEKQWIIAMKELETVRRLICSIPAGSRYRIRVDNMVAFWALRRGRSFCWELNNLVRRIGGDAFARNLQLDVEWIASEDNQADWISRRWNRPLDPGERNSSLPPQ